MPEGELAREWSQRVRDARSVRGLTQGQLAERSGLSQQKISQIEGGRPGGDASRRAVARALGMRPSALFPYPEDLAPEAPRALDEQLALHAADPA